MIVEIFLFVCVCAFTCLFWKWYRVYKGRKELIDRIPGPPNWPIVGHCFEIIGSAEHTWNYIQCKNQEYYPIYRLWNGTMPIVQIIGPHDIEVLLSSKKNLKKSTIYNWMEAWLGTGLLTSTGAKWHYRRKLLTPAFHFGILQQFSKTIIEQSNLLVEQLKDECDKPFTVINPIITKFTLHTICETAMGTRLDEKEEPVRNYVKAIYEMGQLLVDRASRPWLFIKIVYYFTNLRKLEKKLIKILHKFSKSVIENRQQGFQDPLLVSNQTQVTEGKERMALLDLLIAAKNKNASIDNEGIREEVDTFMFEGHDTTSSAILFALVLLSHHSDVQKKIWKEVMEVVEYSERQFTFSDLHNMPYLEMVVKECLRLFPSVPIIARKTECEFTTASGYVIPANTIIHVQIYGVHHNQEIYPNPEKFDPERFSLENSKDRHPYAFIPFSAGPRNCIGQKFAMLEIKSTIASIIRNFVLLPVDTLKDVKFIMHFILKSTENSKIKFERRQ